MHATAIHASPSAARLRQRLLRGLVIGGVAAGLLAFMGAMGTNFAPLGTRFAFWAAVVLPGSVLGFVMQTAVSAWGGLAGLRWAEVALVALLVSLPHSFVVIVASALFFGIGEITPLLVVNFWLAVFVVTLVLTAINRLAATDEPHSLAPPLSAPALAFPEAASAGPVPPSSEAAPPALLPQVPALLAEKLAPPLRCGQLIAIEAEDHYLRIHTDCGSDLVLMRMSDACALMEDAAGLRVHRSWWVAQAAVEGQSRSGSRVELAVTGGLAVPVSRALHRTLRDPAWGYDGRASQSLS